MIASPLRWLVPTVLLPASLAAPASAQYAAKVWAERDGYVIIEAEAVDEPLAPEKWTLLTEPAGYTGSGYLVRTVDGDLYEGALVFDALADTTDLLRYLVWVEEPGTYAVHLRNIPAQPGGETEMWVSINGSPYDRVKGHVADGFTWSAYEKGTWDLEAGVNQVTLAGRHAGFGVDRIVLHRADLPEAVWSDPALPPSQLLQPPLSVDRTPPTPPRGLRAEQTRLAAVALAWEPGEDDGQVLGYEIFANGRNVGSTPRTRFTASGLEPGTDYTFAVAARDLSGNRSFRSESLRVTTDSLEPQRDVAIKYIKRPPVLDGVFDFTGEEEQVLESWHNQAQHPLTRPVVGQPDSTADLSAWFRAAWDDAFLYVLVEALDDVSFLGGASVDGFRLFLDPDHGQSATFGINDRRYVFIGKDQIREETQRERYLDGVVAVQGTPIPPKRPWYEPVEGWFVEMAIPWKTLGVTPQTGMRLGLDVLVQDDDGSGEAEKVAAWAGEGAAAGRSPLHLGTVRLVREIPSGSPAGYLPPQIWQEQDGAVVIEAEEIDYHRHWVHHTAPAGFTGDGYLLWEGPNRSLTPDGRGGNDDYSNERQGPQEEWLIVRVLVENPGLYSIDVRNIHEEEDGDNDAWVWRVGAPITDWAPVQRMGDSLRDGEGFSWLDWGVRQFWLKEGVNDLYVGGRSVGFGIDRIALYRTDDAEAQRRALDLATPTSPLVDARESRLPSRP